MTSAKNNTELADQALAKKLVFNARDLVLQKIPQSHSKTPDYQLHQNGRQVAYCELKSPHDDLLDERFAEAAKGDFFCCMTNDPVFNRITRLANKASIQFESVNRERKLPNILIFVNHDEASNFNDLREVFTGFFFTDDGSRSVSIPNIASRLRKAKTNIDLCIWIDAKTSKLAGFLFNVDATPDYLPQMCSLFGYRSDQIER